MDSDMAEEGYVFLGEIISPRPPYFAGRLGALRAPVATLRNWMF